jgi:hypothetical protein
MYVVVGEECGSEKSRLRAGCASLPRRQFELEHWGTWQQKNVFDPGRHVQKTPDPHRWQLSQRRSGIAHSTR